MPPRARGRFLLTFGFALMAFTLSAGAVQAGWLTRRNEQAARQRAWIALRTRLHNRVNVFPGRVGLVVKDLRTGWEFSLDPDRRVAAASLIKIPMLGATFAAVRAGRLRLDDTLPLTAADRIGGSGVLKGRPVGTAVRVDELLGLMIAHSDNAATNMLIRRLGFEWFDTWFASARLSGTNLSRRMMDFTARAHGVENYTTAADVASVLEALYRRRLVRSDLSELGLDWLKQQYYHDRLPVLLPKGTVVANKTGLERRVCHDAGIVYTPAGDYLICVLTQHRDTTSRRSKRLIAHLSRDVYDYMVGASSSASR